MNIVIFNWRDIANPWAGGSELNVHEMAKRWVFSGQQVTMLVTRSNAHWRGSKTEIIDGITIIRIGGRFSVYILAPLYYFLFLRTWTERIVDVENGIPFFTPLFARKKIICLVNHIHRQIFFKEMWFPFSLIGYILESYAMPYFYRNIHFVAISFTTKLALEQIGIHKENISVIRPGVDLVQFKKGNKTFADPTILYLGKIKRYKNISVLIDLHLRIRQVVPSVKLILAGDGYDRPVIEAIVREKNLSSEIQVLGHVSELEKVRLYQNSWIYVTPSQMEGWGLTVIEANACGLPVVGFSVPGLIDSIDSGNSGYLVKSFEELVEKVVQLLTNNELRHKFKENALQRAQLFSWEKSSEEFLTLLL